MAKTGKRARTPAASSPKKAAAKTPAKKPYNDAAYQQLRECLASIRGWPVSRIKEGTTLEGDMGYDASARGALAPELSDCFAEHDMPLKPRLKPSETRGCSTVGDIDDITQNRV